MNIYLDIDGVLITKDNSPADYVVDFLKYITDNHDVYWLTTHCQGDAQTTILYLKDKLPNDAIPFLKKIKATKWQTLKTEAIDFSKDFRWLDDYVMSAERNVLIKNNALNKLILIDFKNNPEIFKKYSVINQF